MIIISAHVTKSYLRVLTMEILDKKLLTELTKNCRTSYNDLGNKLGYIANAVKKRVEKLIENCTLYSFTIRPTLKTMNADIVIALLETNGKESLETWICYPPK
jgi:DNA-binding Lrp family transcriptional regulator